jgi:hypothetical protein
VGGKSPDRASWRTLTGKLTITAQRLDGPTGDFKAQIGSLGQFGDIGV